MTSGSRHSAGNDLAVSPLQEPVTTQTALPSARLKKNPGTGIEIYDPNSGMYVQFQDHTNCGYQWFTIIRTTDPIGAWEGEMEACGAYICLLKSTCDPLTSTVAIHRPKSSQLSHM